MSCTPISFVLNLVLCLILSCYNLSCQVYTKTLPDNARSCDCLQTFLIAL